VIVTAIGAGSRLTPTCAEPELAARSRATTVIVLSPGPRGTLQLNEEPATRAGTPLHDTLPTPESRSLTLPLTLSGLAATVTPLAGDVMVTAGAVRSRLTLAWAVALFPARSVTVPATSRAVASSPTVTGEGHCTTPESASPHWNETTTSLLFQPSAFGGGAA